MEDHVTLNPAARQLMDKLLRDIDATKTITRTFSEADVIELALRLLDNANHEPGNAPAEHVLGLSVAQFELNRHKP